MYDNIRAWKDEDYRDEVGADPGAHPAGIIDLAAASRAAGLTVVNGMPAGDTVSACAISQCADICSATHCFDAVGSVSWDDPVLVGV